ncbi:hypothetical protein Lesp02_18430 [Lentzea sp. NBRC 105346]|uniref:hypothetical protein n=1 Tax=Lentzea sp. NBRC 105346 TaxID=3032205 RepID=UPI0024A2215C|nr:hypothetical protein [Lentzea sp. NBRC 105346]GLZ29653.1 hypothetical protein Lesp02_18430 [Lentzea sp. NBRC 105346]
MIAGLWFIAAFVAGALGWFQTEGTEPPIVLGVAAGLPPLAVLAALRWSPRFNQWVGTRDHGLLINLQAWRIGGFVFVALWAQGLLPAGFALPAGIGDVAIATTAPFVAKYAPTGRIFTLWTALGILDLVTAVSLGIAHGLTDPAMAIVSRLPLSLIPTFGVPFLLVVHLLSLRTARTAKSDMLDVSCVTTV